MKRVLQLSIALCLTLVCDKAFNGGNITFKLAEHGSAAKDWTAHASARVVRTVSG